MKQLLACNFFIAGCFGCATIGMDFNDPTQLTCDLKVNFVRIWDSMVQWKNVETSRGTYDWTELDKQVQRARGCGAKVSYVFGGTPYWAAKPSCAGLTPCPPPTIPQPANCRPQSTNAGMGNVSNCAVEDPQDLVNFCGAIAGKYKGNISAYEVWNEPQEGMFLWPSISDPTHGDASLTMLGKVTQGCYDQIKANDPSATVLNGGILTKSVSEPTDTKRAANYMTELKKVGWKIDAVNLHIYPKTDALSASKWSVYASSLMSMVKGLGGAPNRYWVTETDYNFGASPVPDSTAEPLVRDTYAEAAKLGVSNIFWYAWDLKATQGGLDFSKGSGAYNAAVQAQCGPGDTNSTRVV